MLWLIDVKYCELERCKDGELERYLKFLLIKKANVKDVIISEKKKIQSMKSLSELCTGRHLWNFFGVLFCRWSRNELGRHQFEVQYYMG